MPQTSRVVVLADAQTITADISVIVNVPEMATAFAGYCKSAGATGTSPTMNVEFYQLVPTAVAADTPGLKPSTLVGDYSSFTAIGFGQLAQFTATAATRIFGVVGGGNYEAAAGLPAVSTWRSGPIGSLWRVTFNVGGTNPSFTGVECVIRFNP